MPQSYNPLFILIDDDSDDLELIKYGLEKFNSASNIISFTNGAGALDFLSDSKHKIIPSLIIVDCNMPLMNGIEFMESLRQMDNYKSIPTLMYSTDIRKITDDVKSKLDLKALTKSYSVSELNEHVKYMFGLINRN